MKSIFAAMVTGLLVLSSFGRGSADDNKLLVRMAAVNPQLHSYTATLHAHVALTSFPFLAADLVGTVYHKDPDSDKVEITSGMPMIGQQFSKLYPHITPASQWNNVYVVTQTGDDGKETSFRLVPRKQGNVEHIDAKVDDTSATVSSMRWSYANGGSASTTYTYSTVDGNLVVTAETGSADEPSYKGNITSTLDHYAINPNIPDATFQEQ